MRAEFSDESTFLGNRHLEDIRQNLLSSIQSLTPDAYQFPWGVLEIQL